MSLATNASGAVVSRQDYDPWGSLRTGGISQTTINYTGQRRDGTGLLYYHARYYDPVLARFLSADSVVPGAPDGSMDGVALKPLTVDFHEPGFVSGLNAENQYGFWFQHSDQVAPWGPQNPQALNRYAYVQNNPLRYTDPSGHVLIDEETASAMWMYLKEVLWNVEELIVGNQDRDDVLGALATILSDVSATLVGTVAAGVLGAIIGGVMGAVANHGVLSNMWNGLPELSNFLERITSYIQHVINDERSVYIDIYVGVINKSYHLSIDIYDKNFNKTWPSRDFKINNGHTVRYLERMVGRGPSVCYRCIVV